MESILVTGGAGYIGSVAVKKLIQKGFKVVVVDNLSKGLKELVDKEAIFYELDLVDKEKLESVFKKHKFDYVMHFAGYKAAGESMENAIKYSDNIKATINLLDLIVKYKVKKIIYSSSAGVYGDPKYTPMDENHSTSPINYYGHTKLICEDLIKWYSKVYGFNYVCLRYFNVAGDGGLNYVDPVPLNILPLIMDTIVGKREKLLVFGDDYDTPDGTCIRDYIDVLDLIDAHILAINLKENEIINLGTSKGTSVKELIDYSIKVSGKKFNFEIVSRRPGDPAILVASNEKAKKVLNWNPKNDYKQMIESTYNVYINKLNNSKSYSSNKDDISLVCLVAGISKRFGFKIKSLEKVGPNNETLLEYILNGAIKVKPKKIILVVRKENKENFKEIFKDNYKGIPVYYAIQEHDSTKRNKPWGTIDAVCCSKEFVDSKIIVCNGDDVCMEESFKKLAEHLRKDNTDATIAYILGKSIPDKGEVTRGIFNLDQNGEVDTIVEHFRVSWETLEEHRLTKDSLCNMNLFGFHKNTLELLNKELDKFKEENKDNPDSECILPTELNKLIKKDQIKLKVYVSNDSWLGITNPGDELIVKEELKKLEKNNK
jgi:UDP-glucose 4-epimerase